VSVASFDCDDDTINCRNGIVDLRTSELQAHAPDQMVMKRANATYVAKAECPLWHHFLTEVFQGDEDLIAFMHRVLGYSLTGRIDEHCLFIAYGLGSNGKTTLFETVLEIVGDYGRTTEFSNFLASDKQDTRKMEAVGLLRGVRMAIASETDSTKKWHESLVKKLTGGDTLIGTKMYGDSYEFTPTHKLWFQANHLPTVRDASHGFWRRINVIPFNARFEAR
jgi:putative DNA primase/helicase